MVTFQPADNLRSRTFFGLLIAQFLAAFNDQAIHASAMFFAIKSGALTEPQAISLMPILFYAPWALFCTLAGYLADRFSKYYSLVFWKFAEVGITAIALLGFWLGNHGNSGGPWIVLSTVFLMGMHSAFFVPAKYGVMPEILHGRMLSRGNGVLESLSFLAVILGTVSGGVLSDERVFGNGQEYKIGFILLGLAIVGSVASLLIRRMPAANPARAFPRYLYGPLVRNIRDLLSSRPLAFAVIGIAFFTFIVAFMRTTVYMFGESQAPRWHELQTSLLVGMVALGIGIGSPLVGFLSGGKVELGLVPIGALGMMAATLIAAIFLDVTPALAVCIILIGFFTGFYIVPLFTLLQHRAPKTSKGDSIATSNFINVTGAILASLVFYLLDWGATASGIAPVLPQQDHTSGFLLEAPEYKDGRPYKVVIDRRVITEEGDQDSENLVIIEVDSDDLIDAFKDREPLKQGDRVIQSTYQIGKVTYHRIRRADVPRPRPAYDKRHLPQLLFLAASGMTLLTLVLLRLQLPDLFLRTRLWFHWQGSYKLEVSGMHHLPVQGPAVLAPGCDNAEACLQVLGATDRTTRLLILKASSDNYSALVEELGEQRGLGVVPLADLASVDWKTIRDKAECALQRGEIVTLPLPDHWPVAPVDQLVEELLQRKGLPVVPVYYGVYEPNASNGSRPVYVILGPAVPAGANAAAVREEIRRLGELLRAQRA